MGITACPNVAVRSRNCGLGGRVTTDIKFKGMKVLFEVLKCQPEVIKGCLSKGHRVSEQASFCSRYICTS